MRGKRARRQVDPRLVIFLVTMVGLLLVWGVAVALQRGSASALSSLTYVRSDLEEPRRHLAQALDANVDGQLLLQGAAAATGDHRGALLAESIAAAETSAEAWTEYLASAVGLADEATLAATYERDYATGKEIAADVLVPIIQSSQPQALPDEQVTAAAMNRADLRALIDLYDRAAAMELRSFAERLERANDDVSVGAVVAAVVVLLGGGVGERWAKRVVAARRARDKLAELEAVEAQLIRALELCDDEEGAFGVAANAVGRSLPGAQLSVLAMDPAATSLVPVVGERPACGVDDPGRCPALRAGAVLQFPDSGALDACPVLASSATVPCSATCVPVSVAGADAGLIHLVGEVGQAPEIGQLVHLTVRRVGERVTLLRAMAGWQALASRDPLTGLLNRRSFEAATGHLVRDGVHYAVAFVDLDHFKLLNDVHGHDAGDRALREFARTLRDTLRPEDIACRWGGEEFVVALPRCTEAQAIAVMERLRTALVGTARHSVAVTVSCGVTEANPWEPLDEAVSRADSALLQAKVEGRDRVVAWTPPRVDAPTA